LRRKICIVSPSLQVGGIERMLTLIANYFFKRGLEVTFISCLNKDKFYQLESGIDLIEPPFERTSRPINKVLYYVRLVFFLRRQVLKANPEAVLSFGEWFNPVVLLALYGTKFPVFISDRTSPDFRFFFPIPQLIQWLYPRSEALIVQTQIAYKYKLRQFNNKVRVHVIPNAIRNINLDPAIKREKIILYVGRLSWEKGPDRLIRAYFDIPDKDNWELHFAGSGPLIDEMKQLANSFSTTGTVVFYGNVKDIDSLYAKAGIYVIPSLLEGFPNSLCEAMAAGLPCICFDSIPYSEIFTNHHDGIAVKSDDIKGLSTAMIDLMNSDGLRERIGSNARNIGERLSIERVGEQFYKLIFEDEFSL